MTTHLWGLSGGYWHALTRHDPAYKTKLATSDKLTARARAKDPDAKPVEYRVLDGVPGPGMGSSLCSLTGLALERIGVDPEPEDPLCPACKAKAAAK